MNNYQLTIAEVLDIIKVNIEIVRDITGDDTSTPTLYKQGKTKLISSILTYSDHMLNIREELSESMKSMNNYSIAINSVIEMIDDTFHDAHKFGDDITFVKCLAELDTQKLVALFLTFENLTYQIENIMEEALNA